LGVGIYQADVLAQKLALPATDCYPLTIEEKIITYADLFFSKNPTRLWEERTVALARQKLSEYNPNRLAVFEAWLKQFG
jgi:uncharacterized protein